MKPQTYLLSPLLLAQVAAASYEITYDCDPCIDREVSRLAAIVPQEGDAHPIRSALEQVAADMNVQLAIYSSQDVPLLDDQDVVDAWIVTLGDIENANVARQLVDAGNLIFGWGWGYQDDVAFEAAGWIASNDANGAKAAAGEIYNGALHDQANESLVQVAYVLDESSIDAQAQLRSEAFQAELQAMMPNTTQWSMELAVSTNDPQTLVALFEDCPQHAILFDTPESVFQAMELREQYGCVNTTMGAFLHNYDTHLNPQLYQAITRGQLDFVLDPQMHLQASMISIMASLYVTTGKKPAFPSGDANSTHAPTYWTGPELIHKRNVPSDTTAACQTTAFPVCQQQQQEEEEQTAADSQQVDWLGLDDTCPCTPRQEITIGGVIHGTPGSFWDPVFASAEQAALDMGVELDLTPFTSKEDFDLLVEQMSARIRNMCESGVDGLMVSIPDPRVADAVQRCLDLFVPVISINSGVEESKQLGLIHHIGQNEYAGGYEAAQRLIAAGMTKGFCVDHEFGNSALAERCQGFRDGIKATEGVEFIKHVAVPRDNDEEFRINIEEAVGDEQNWIGAGFLQLSASSFRSLRPLLEEHPGAVAGTFDLKDYVYDAIEDNILLFAIDQQPFLQGNLPIYLLTYAIYTRQSISNHLIQSGPSFVTSIPSEEQKLCEANSYAVCPDRPEEKMNYIPSSILAVGYALFGIVALFALVALAWTFLYKDLWVVKVSQPMFLGLVVLGTFVSSLSIPFMGVQTSYRLDQDESGQFIEAENPEIGKVDASCMAVPWLYGIGFVITFSALLTKILRVRLMFLAGKRMSPKKVTLADVIPVMAIMLLLEIIILTCWQIIAPLQWSREVTDTTVDGFATQSVGSCTASSGSSALGFYLALMAFHVICLCYALVLCHQTRQLSNDFAESSYVSLAVAFLFQVLVLTAPILALVSDNAKAFYFVRVAAVFLQNITVLLLIFVPKMRRMHEERRIERQSQVVQANNNINTGDAVVAPPEQSESSYGPDSAVARASGDEMASRDRPGSLGIEVERFHKPRVAPCASTGSDQSKLSKDSWAGITLSESEEPHSVSLRPPPSGRAVNLPKDSWAAMNLSEVEQPAQDPSGHLSVIDERSEDESKALPGQSENKQASGAPILSSEEVLMNWEELGFPSADFALQFVDLLSRSTDPTRRHKIASGLPMAQGSSFRDERSAPFAP